MQVKQYRVVCESPDNFLTGAYCVAKPVTRGEDCDRIAHEVAKALRMDLAGPIVADGRFPLWFARKEECRITLRR